MQAVRMWNLAVAAALCCSPMLAQAPGGSSPGGAGQMQQPSGANSPSSMDQQQQQMGTSGMNTGPAVDKAFVKKALEGNVGEIEMGKLALQKSNDDQVKQFAQRMVDDHGKMQDELKPAAEQMGVKVPEGPSKSQMKSMDKIKDMVKDHKGDDNDFKMEAQSTQNPQLKQMVMQSDQTIESHLQQIQQIAKSKGTQKAKM
jgi:putative membrane protein